MTLPQNISFNPLRVFDKDFAAIIRRLFSSRSKVVQSSLYFSSGACFTGNRIAAFSSTNASNVVVKVRALEGRQERIISDSNAAPSNQGDSPVAIVDWNKDSLFALVQNSFGSRIEYVPKNGGPRCNFGLSPGPELFKHGSKDDVQNSRYWFRDCTNRLY